MPSISEPERKGSTPSPADSNCTQCNHHKASHISPARKGCVALIPGLHGRLTECRCGTYVPPIVVVEHPDDECECSHKRSEHAATKGPLGTLPCRAEDENFNYVDNCTDFKLHRTALQAAVELGKNPSSVCTGEFKWKHRPVDITSGPCFICKHRHRTFAQIDANEDGEAWNYALSRPDNGGASEATLNELCTCGHAAMVHTSMTGNCLAHGLDTQDDSHCLEFHAQKLYCGVCGHPHHLHDDYNQCKMTDCACGAEEREAALSSMINRLREPDIEDPPVDRDMWFPAAPGGEATNEPAPPTQTGVPAYRVVYVTDDDTYYAIDVPYGVNASVIDGQLRLWHAGNRIVGITANITSIQEHSQT